MSWMMALSGSSGSSSPKARPTSVSYVAPSGALLSMTIFVTFARAAGAPAQITAAMTKATRARSRARDGAFTVASSLCDRLMRYGGEGAWVDLSPHRVKPRRVDARKEMLRTIAAGYAAFAFHASRAAACSRLLSFLRWSSQMNPKRGPRDIWRHPATRQRMSSLRRLRPVWAAAPRPIRPRASCSSSLTSVPTRSRSELASCSTIRSTNVWAIAARFPHARCTPSKTKVQFPLQVPEANAAARQAVRGARTARSRPGSGRLVLRCVPGGRDRPGDRLQQVVHADGLAEDVDDAEVVGPISAVRAAHHDRNLPQAVVLAERVDHLDPRDAGHHQIEEHDGRTDPAAQRLQRFASVGGGEDAVPLGGEDIGHRLSDVEVVVDDQHHAATYRRIRVLAGGDHRT